MEMNVEDEKTNSNFTVSYQSEKTLHCIASPDYS